MSFRIEEKSKFHISDYLKIRSLIEKEGGHSLYSKRKISSLYFDNKELSMFLDSEEGSVPRKKLRIRNYPDNIVDYYLEKKLRVSKENLKLAKRKQKKKFLILRQMEFLISLMEIATH